MRPFSAFRSQRGQSAIEVLIAATVLAIAAQAVTLLIRLSAKQSVMNRDKAFATEKAIQMMEEIRNQVSSNAVEVAVLDNQYADDYYPGTGRIPKYKFTLTTNAAVRQPPGVSPPSDAETGEDPLSANPIRANGYAFVRHIDIRANTLDANVRQVWVRVYEAAPNSGTASDSSAYPPAAMAKDPAKPPLAEVFGMVHSLGAANRPSQVMDLYLIALENVPGWWSRTSNLIPLMQSSLVSLQARNPGLKIRSHWIRRMSFGRDLEYTPETNSAKSATVTAAFTQTYVYPGMVNYDDGQDFYYLPSWFQGRIILDGTLTQNMRYPIADQFNHAMRYPDEVTLYNTMSKVAANAGQDPPEISYRMLLELMANNSTEVRNAIIINLHGEMVPVVPLRNYSDPAKDPAWYYTERVAAPYSKTARAFRAVTHPERLYYSTTIAGHGDPAVNVYAFDALPPATDYSDPIDVITLFVPGADLGNLKQVEWVEGNSINAYYRNIENASNWNNSGTEIYDGPTSLSTASNFVADEYTPAGRSIGQGLRIRLYGVTPTARAYNGPRHP